LLRPPGSTIAYRWDEKSGLHRDAISSQVIDALEAQEIKEADYEEAYPMSEGLTLNRKCERLTIGLDLGDRWSCY